MHSESDARNPEEFILKVLQSLDIPIEHSKRSHEETAYWLEHDGLDDPALEDMTHLPFVTIDNEDSRDLDQALLIERADSGYRLHYALADAAYYIRPGSALFAEALQRGTTYYTPLLAASMLPVELSEGLISLNPDVLRRALVFTMDLNAQALVTRCSISRAKIMSQAKLSYAGVQHWLDTNSSVSASYHPSLQLLKELGSKLVLASEARGVIRFNRTETDIKLTDVSGGSSTGATPHLEGKVRRRYDTERYNEQISLLCNMQGAELLLGLAGVTNVTQAIYRVHEAPLRESLNTLHETLNALADTMDGASKDGHQWRWQKGTSLARFVADLPTDQKHKRCVQAVQRQIMQAQRGSTFTPESGEHHALKVCSYARFSSPMREVVGIYTHKELLEGLSGVSFDNQADEFLRKQVIEAANSAKQRQRKLDKQIEFAALQSVFAGELRAESEHWHEGTIVGMRSDKMYVNLDDMALDVKIYRDDLNTAYTTDYTITQACATAEDIHSPVWLLGQGIRLRIQSCDKQRQRFVFSLYPIDSNGL